MTARELKELERLAKTAIEQYPEESDDILERALLDRKDALWHAIQKDARRRMRLRRARPWIAAAAVVMLAVIVSGTIGVNQARAGKDGLLVDIVEGVAGSVAFSDMPAGFLPITVENGTWENIMNNVDPALASLLPEGLPDTYVFESGSIDQPSPTEIKMSLIYINTDTKKIKMINYMYLLNNSEINEKGTGEYMYRRWDKTDVHILGYDEVMNIVWQQGDCFIELFGIDSEEEGRLWFDAIQKEP